MGAGLRTNTDTPLFKVIGTSGQLPAGLARRFWRKPLFYQECTSPRIAAPMMRGVGQQRAYRETPRRDSRSWTDSLRLQLAKPPLNFLGDQLLDLQLVEIRRDCKGPDLVKPLFRSFKKRIVGGFDVGVITMLARCAFSGVCHAVLFTFPGEAITEIADLDELGRVGKPAKARLLKIQRWMETNREEKQHESATLRNGQDQRGDLAHGG